MRSIFARSVHHASFEFSYICALYFCFLHGIKDVVTHHYIIIIYIPFKHNPADICMLKIHKPVTIHSLRIWAGSIIKELFTAIYIYLQCSCNNHKFFMPPLTTTMLPSGRKHSCLYAVTGFAAARLQSGTNNLKVHFHEICARITCCCNMLRRRK